MIKHIAFDFDGTLVDSAAVFVESFNLLARKKGFRKIDNENLEALRSLSLKERFRFLNVPLYQLPFLTPQFLSIYKTRCRDLKTVKGIKELLQQLQSGGHHLSILSTNDEQIIKEVLKNNEIECVHRVYTSTKLFGKERLIRSFLKACKLKPPEMIYVGDEIRDIEACKKAGVKIAWVSWGYDLKKMAVEKAPDYMIEQPSALLSIPGILPAMI